MPEIRRIDYAAHLEQAAPDDPADPGRAGLIANDAARLVPLQRIQVAFDQTIARADAVARGGPWDYSGSLAEHVASTLEYVRRSVDVLRTAAAAAQAIVDDFTAILTPLTEPNMSGQNPDEGPQLTVSGEPHPLQQGGYNPTEDAGKDGNISGVEALKEGKATQAQIEALAVADTRDNTSDKPPKPTEELQAERSQQAAAGGTGTGGAEQPPAAGDRPAAQATAPERPEPKKAPRK